MCDSLRSEFECPADATAYTTFQYVWCTLGFLMLTLAIIQLIRLHYYTKSTFLRNGIMHPNPVELAHIGVLIATIIWNIRDPDPLGWWLLFPQICVAIFQEVVTLIILLLVVATSFTWVRVILKLNGKIEQISKLDWIERIMNLIIIPLVLTFTVVQYIYGPFWLYNSLVLTSETVYVLVMNIIDCRFGMPSFRILCEMRTNTRDQLGIFRIYQAIVVITIFCFIGIAFAIVRILNMISNHYDYHSNPPKPPPLPTSPWEEGIIGFVQISCLLFFLIYFREFVTNEVKRKLTKKKTNTNNYIPKLESVPVSPPASMETKMKQAKSLSSFDFTNLSLPDGYFGGLDMSRSATGSFGFISTLRNVSSFEENIQMAKIPNKTGMDINNSRYGADRKGNHHNPN